MGSKKEYILGTNEKELTRLELQHKVWASEAKRGWDFADFKSGHTILDLGCGPGYCTKELAYIVGEKGKAILEFEETLTFKDLTEKLGIRRRVNFAVNGEHDLDDTHVLKDGDEVLVFSTVSGG